MASVHVKVLLFVRAKTLVSCSCDTYPLSKAEVSREYREKEEKERKRGRKKASIWVGSGQEVNRGLVLVLYAFSGKSVSWESAHVQAILDQAGMHPVLINSPTALALKHPDPPTHIQQIWRSEWESQQFSKRAAQRSGGSAYFGTLLSFAQDLVQASRHVVGPGGRTVIPLQVFTWDQVPAQEVRGRSSRRREQRQKEKEKT